MPRKEGIRYEKYRTEIEHELGIDRIAYEILFREILKLKFGETYEESTRIAKETMQSFVKAFLGSANSQSFIGKIQIETEYSNPFQITFFTKEAINLIKNSETKYDFYNRLQLPKEKSEELNLRGDVFMALKKHLETTDLSSK